MDNHTVLGVATYLGDYIVYSYNEISLPENAVKKSLREIPVDLAEKLTEYGKLLEIYMHGNAYYVVLVDKAGGDKRILKIVPMNTRERAPPSPGDRSRASRS